MASSTFYYELDRKDMDELKNTEIMREIREIFETNQGRYGVLRVYHEMRRRGHVINHKKVQRLMKKMNLKGKVSEGSKYRSYKGEVGETADNVIDRDFVAQRPLQKCTTDITQFTLPFGKVYLSPVLDMYTNEIIAYDISQSPNLEQISRMLGYLFDGFDCPEGMIMHSDQGWQYQHPLYVDTLKEHGIIQSMSRKANCLDNSIMESFFGRLKTEMFYGNEKSFESFSDFSAAIDGYIYYYNNERIQKKTKWMPPTEYRKTSIL